MRAVQMAKTGGPEVLDCVEVPKPAIKHGQVLVRIHAIGVGKPDVLVRTGVYKWMPPLPAIPGIEDLKVCPFTGDRKFKVERLLVYD